MILLLILYFFSQTAQAQAPAETASDKEVETYLEAVKDKEVEESLKNSAQFKKCKAESEKDENKGTETQAFETCMKDEFASVADDQIEELAENLDLKSYNKKAAKSAESIRDYLSKRLRKALYGVDDLEKAKLADRNMVNHDVYYQLYAEQIGKNTLLEVSKYCLENISIRDKENILRVSTNASTQAIEKIEVIKALKGDPAALDVITYNILEVPSDSSSSDSMQVQATYSTTQSASAVNQFFKLEANNLKETQLCSFQNKSECDNQFESKPYKSVTLIEKLKEAEYKLAAASPGGTKAVLKSNYLFCATGLIRNMCELYKCKNVYDSNASDEQIAYCKAAFNHTVSTPGSDDNGAIACNVMKRLGEYRSILAATQKIQEERRELAKGQTGGLSTAGVFKGVYSSKGKNSIDNLTSISSNELTQNVEAFANAEEYAQELKDNCLDENGKLIAEFEKNEDCAILANKLDKAGIDNIEINEIAITEVQKKELEKVNTEDELIAFLQKNGMSEYLQKDAEGNLTGKYVELAKNGQIDQIRQALKGELEADKKSLIANLKNRFRSETKIETAEENDTAAIDELASNQKQVADETIADIEQHTRRVKALYEYSNIVSSYLTVQDESGAVVSTNDTGRNIELSDQDSDALNQYFQGEDAGGEGSSGNINYLQAIDQIIGVTSKSAEELALERAEAEN